VEVKKEEQAIFGASPEIGRAHGSALPYRPEGAIFVGRRRRARLRRAAGAHADGDRERWRN
jgi:hypothetical protein